MSYFHQFLLLHGFFIYYKIMTLKGKNNILFLGMCLFYAFLPMSAFSGKIQKPVYDTQTFCKMFGCFVLHSSRTAESADTSFRIRKGVGFLEIYRKVRHNHHLRDTLAGEDGFFFRAVIKRP